MIDERETHMPDRETKSPEGEQGANEVTEAAQSPFWSRRRRIALRIVLWFLLVVSIFMFIAIMFGGLSRGG